MLETDTLCIGAFGGNKTIMALLQILAAKAANVDTLVYHTFSKQYTDAYLDAQKIADSLFKDCDSNGDKAMVIKLPFRLSK